MTAKIARPLAERAAALAHVHSAIAAYAYGLVGEDPIADAQRRSGEIPGDVIVFDLDVAVSYSRIALLGLTIAVPCCNDTAAAAIRRHLKVTDGSLGTHQLAAAIEPAPGWLATTAAAEREAAAARRNWRRQMLVRIVGFAKSGAKDRGSFDQLEHDVWTLLQYHRSFAAWLCGFLGDAPDFPPDNTPHFEVVPWVVVEALNRLRNQYNDFVEFIPSREIVLSGRASALPSSSDVERQLGQVREAEFAVISALGHWRSEILREAKQRSVAARPQLAKGQSK